MLSLTMPNAVTTVNSRYVAPTSAADLYQLPPMEEILHDFRKAAGSWSDFLQEHIVPEHHKPVLTQILEAINQPGNAALKQQFKQVQHAGDQARLIQVRESLQAMACSRSSNSIAAAKILLEEEKCNRLGIVSPLNSDLLVTMGRGKDR